MTAGRRVKIILKSGHSWVYEVGPDFTLNYVHRILNKAKSDTWITLSFDHGEELIIKHDSIWFIDLGYNLTVQGSATADGTPELT